MLETFLTADVLAIAQFFISFLRLVMVPVEVFELLEKEAVATLNQVLRWFSYGPSMLPLRVLLL